MDECGVGAIKAFHAEADVELILSRIHRSLQVQTDVVQKKLFLNLLYPMNVGPSS